MQVDRRLGPFDEREIFDIGVGESSSINISMNATIIDRFLVEDLVSLVQGSRVLRIDKNSGQSICEWDIESASWL